ncbi:peroxiredoxin [Bacteroidetes/Chlorobi group bacterium ChocPot_Mid]|jgi:alkyl hydroperoxide reductase subunit AhpC|nr:MAG: peroxiredoxin [Bacteroidetes/Chlorobi group bacterium ChocPot_Mid]
MGLLVGQKAPFFKGKAVVGGDAAKLNPDNAFKEISLDDYKGKWVVLFFYPLDFTFVCPTEIEDFGLNYEKFKELNCEVIACSTDSHFSHLAWRQNHAGLKNLPYPMLADFTRQIAKDYEILKEETGYALRGLYIINPDGVLQYTVIHPENVGRNSSEVLRVLQGLQSGKLTPCNWQPGQKTLN